MCCHGQVYVLLLLCVVAFISGLRERYVHDSVSMICTLSSSTKACDSITGCCKYSNFASMYPDPVNIQALACVVFGRDNKS